MSEKDIGDSGKVVERVYHGVDGRRDFDYLSAGPNKIFAQPPSPLFRFQVKHHRFFCARGGEWSWFPKEEGAEVVGGAGTIPEEIAVVEGGGKGCVYGDGATEGGGESLLEVKLGVNRRLLSK